MQQLKHETEYALRGLRPISDLVEKIFKSLKIKLRVSSRTTNGGHIEVRARTRILRSINENGAILWV